MNLNKNIKNMLKQDLYTPRADHQLKKFSSIKKNHENQKEKSPSGYKKHKERYSQFLDHYPGYAFYRVFQDENQQTVLEIKNKVNQEILKVYI